MSETWAELDLPSRLPSIEGAVNFRDVGGYPTFDGRLTRWRTLYRSASLHDLTPAGTRELFSARAVRQVIDLRWPHEIDTRPDRVPTGVRYRWVSLLPFDTPPHSARRADYKTIVEQRTRECAAIARLLLEVDGLPCVIHCAEGIDRTGVAVALILDAVGVVPRAIEEDYLQLTGAAGAELDAASDSRAVIREVFDLVRQRYGGSTGLLQAGGITAAQASELADRLIQDRLAAELPAAPRQP